MVHDYETLEILIKAGAKNDIISKSGASALTTAASGGDVKMLKILTKAGVDIKGKPGGAALRAAACMGEGEAVVFLIREGADVNAKGGYKDMTPLICAAKSGFERNMYQLLGSEPEIHPRDLLKTVSEGTNFIEGKLLHHDPKEGMEINGNFLKEVIDTVEKGHFAALKSLLENGADVNAIDDSGETALMKAAKMGDAMTINILLNNGADINSKDLSGKTALIYALENDNQITANILKQAGAKEPSEDGSPK